MLTRPKKKKLTNVRASGRDDTAVLAPVKPMTLESAINYIGEDEMVEITPESIRLRKTLFSSHERHQKRGTSKKQKSHQS